MSDLEKLSSSLVLCLIPIVLFFLIKYLSIFKTKDPSKVPKSYPIFGHFFAFYKNRNQRMKWITEVLRDSPNNTFVVHVPIGSSRIITADPGNIKHILKTRFSIYEKGNFFRTMNSDFLGHGIFNVDGENWKFQRQVSSHEFNTKSLRRFVEHVVDVELNERLIPILCSAAKNGTILDFQDILQRFTFDNICKIAFGYDPEYLIPSLPQAKFAVAFDDAVMYSSKRGGSSSPMMWKLKRFFNIGSEKNLRSAVNEVRNFAKEVINLKSEELGKETSQESLDLLSRFLNSGHLDENFVTDVVISFILAGRDTTSAALTWFFWLLSKNQEIEDKILKEINEKSDDAIYNEVKEMVYTHAALTESMRLYPPVPIDVKEAIEDDVLPDDNIVRKGMRVVYHVYAMGRMEALWGEDWADFNPGRWLERDQGDGNWRFVGRDAYTYPVFQAGPRICLGKDMAYLQMKRVVAGTLRRFKVVPMAGEGVEPVFVAYLTSKMEGGFPVQIVERNQI